MSVVVPEGWTAEISAMDDGKLTYGLYGFILKPKSADAGQVELFCSDSFGVCGTGLSQEEVTLAGYTAHVGTYDDKNTGELIYGEDYTLEKLEGEKWEAVPTIIDNGVFTDIGYNIPKNGEAEIETNWEWLYGKLGSGTYKITKDVLDSGVSSEGDSLNRYTMSAQFLIVG